jgi:transposase
MPPVCSVVAAWALFFAVNAARGLTKACGHRMPPSSTRCFAQRSLAVMPPGLQQALAPVLQQIAETTLKIKQYDRQIQQLTQTEYPETQALMNALLVTNIWIVGKPSITT